MYYIDMPGKGTKMITSTELFDKYPAFFDIILIFALMT